MADFICGYPLFFLIIGGGLYLFIASGAVSLRRLPHAVHCLRQQPEAKNARDGEISSVQALMSAVAGTVGLGSIAGVAIALAMGGPGAIFWMWISALVGMCTKYHEGALAVMYRGRDTLNNVRGGMFHIIENGLGKRWRAMAVMFAVAGLFGTLCIINANQLTQAIVTMAAPSGAGKLPGLAALAGTVGIDADTMLKLIVGITIAAIVAVVVLRGVTRIARVASVLVPFMVGLYFVMVTYIILSHFGDVPRVVQSIFSQAFNLKAGFGALAGTAIIGARRAALVNDAGIGTASIMHGVSKNDNPVREGLIAMLGPAIDSGLVCTLTAIALLLCADPSAGNAVRGLDLALETFGRAIPMGDYLLMFIVICFALSSMFSYSYYGTSCATYLFGTKHARRYTYLYIVSLTVFAVVPLSVAVSMCDLFYALMAIPAMSTILLLSHRVRRVTRLHFDKASSKSSTVAGTNQ